MRLLSGRPRGLASAVLAILFAVLSASWAASAAEKAPPNDVTKAEHYLRKLEDHARRARGAAFKPGYEDNEALKRIKELKEKYPDDPAVEALFARARTALMGSKGDFIEITPEMLRYRDQEKKIVELFSKEAVAQIAAWKAKASAGGKLLAQALPAPGLREPAAAGMPGKYVVLDKVEYPANQFTDLGREYLSWGTPARGLYYVQLDTPPWRGAYEALKRYRRLVNAGLAEGTPFTVAGRIESAELTVPEAGKKRLGGAFWGWVVVPEVIWVDGLAFAAADRNAELGGRFAGEERIEEIKGPLYSVKAIPPDVTPERLVETFATAIKEKNLKLYLDCIDPKFLGGPRAKSLAMYHWDWHQVRFRDFYVHVTIDKVEKTVVKGYDAGNDLESFFLTDEQKAQARKISEPSVERATVTTKAWDERGRQYGSPKPHELIRRGGGRWYVFDFAAQF
ncbi:MAG: hypothetical protein IPP07_09505 [Holophagales bacterium]|nr:hypothetical protein [Holophagales bacterium]MBK9965106.1 hypothetical protein [Holophagales bacterium]